MEDPFQDDELRTPPPPPADARSRRSHGKTSVARLHFSVPNEPTPAEPIATESMVVKRVAPKKAEVQPASAEVLIQDDSHDESLERALEVVKLKGHPKNPLRD